MPDSKASTDALSASPPKNLSTVSLNSTLVVTRNASRALGKMLLTMRECLTCSGSSARIDQQVLVLLDESQRLCSTNSRLRFFSTPAGLMRSALNGSYGTP